VDAGSWCVHIVCVSEGTFGYLLCTICILSLSILVAGMDKGPHTELKVKDVPSL